MKVLVSGSTGLVGSALVRELQTRGHEVVRLVRRNKNFKEAVVEWDIEKGKLNPADLAGIDAVIHLAGENIVGRWTKEKKRKIEDSRVNGTTLLAETLAKMDNPPKAFISASAIGFYGDAHGSEVLTETTANGHGFLACVCRKWEAATQPARDKGIRVVNVRTAVVLSMKGGALKLMYWPFRLGVAGDLGFGGKQYFSWITLQDEVGGIIHCLENETLRGPVNFSSPNPVTNHEFTTTLRRHLLPAPIAAINIPLPAWKIRMLTGEMGKEMFLASERVLPVRLQETGYQFKHPTLKEAFKALI